MCFSKVAENVQKGALCLTSRSRGLCMFQSFMCHYSKSDRTPKLKTVSNIDMVAPKLHKIQTPLHVHLEVTFICTFLAYSILRITGNFPYKIYSSLICCRTSVNTRWRQSYTFKACSPLRTGTFLIMSSTLKRNSHLETVLSIMELEKQLIGSIICKKAVMIWF